MSNTFGETLKVTIFGESHGTAIGAVIDGLPAGISIDWEEVRREMARRAPGSSNLATPRKEKDSFEILSGYFNGHTTGTPLAMEIRNGNQHSKDYDILKDHMRPGHADYTGFVKYGGFNDYRGGGHFPDALRRPSPLPEPLPGRCWQGKEFTSAPMPLKSTALKTVPSILWGRKRFFLKGWMP